ncbi:MAG: [protein-PII] uridylyltransferase [Desulfuromonas sp.]|uniref:[protein-PII] uridylyltransferase n=1 Tax=Desulfuromonas sp. TaxID=892 RepID=UPI000CACADF8|nr:[protein-PII] uridylyltransferase [Desulfuromonas sp.]PLX85153.1 MAG: [protein-PII] uridylyltransferase [Desulfuromonas sp.]
MTSIENPQECPEKTAKPFFSPKELTDPGIPFEERRANLLEASSKYLGYFRDCIREKHRQGASGREIVGRLTAFTDTLLRNLYCSLSADLVEQDLENCALIALGGYGRAELNPGSDIDLMFFYGGKDRTFAEQVSERMLYLLWDLGFDVGHSVRTAKDCLDMAERDITARTALLDGRYLVGSETLYREFEQSVLKPVMGRNTKAFLREKIEENDRRLGKYGSSVYLLEPNIQEGEGGLRDLHTAIWMARVKFKASSLRDLLIKGVLTEQEEAAFEQAFDYLWRIRNELHYISPRKNEQIHFDQQEQIAKFLGYRDSKRALAVEQFMQDYYAHATEVEHLASTLITKATQQEEQTTRILGYFTRRNLEDGFYVLRGELRVSVDDLFEKDPALMMRAFLLAKNHGVRLSVPLKGLIRANLHRINDRVRRSRAMTDDFFGILRKPHGVGDTLLVMHHLRFLNRFIPEFERIYCNVQHDLYHIYTVDIHSIFALEEIAKLWRGDYARKKPLLTKIANDIEKRELLLLAVLLHDIGKGEGKDHCNKGADMIPTIARRLGLNKEDSQRLEFLVRQHLLMAHNAQRRDLHDDKLILQFARTMGMSENLKMLYLLTFADIKAVGPEVWSEWKGFLLQELYEKTYDVLERGDFRLEKRSEKVRNRKRKVVGLLEEEFGTKVIKGVLRGMNTRYLLSHRSAEIAEHLRVFLGRGEKPLAMKVEQGTQGEYTQLTISTVDIPGLFSKITGVMAANGINILGAQIYTQNQGVALDILQVSSLTGEIIVNPEKWRRVQKDLVGVVEGRLRVKELVKRCKEPSFVGERPKPRFTNRVEIDNEVSDEYTVVDIYAHDKVGLLYQITRTLKELGYYIGVSKISTKVDQIADTFYIQDIFAQKVTFEDKLEELNRRLLECLDAELGS